MNEKEYKKRIYERVKKYIFIKKWDIRVPDLDFWLENFKGDDEQYLAHYLLARFIYYNKTEILCLYKRLFKMLIRQMFVDQCKSTNKIITEDKLCKLVADFWEQTIFTHITGSGKPTDSGRAMCRYYLEMDINSNQIFSPHEVPKLLLSNNNYKHVV